MAIRVSGGIAATYTAPPPFPFYLKAGIEVADCVFAYAPDEADDLADSYVNLAHPGTNNAAPGVAPSWASVTGWTFDGVNDYLTTGAVPTRGEWTVLVLYSVDTFEATRRDMFGVSEGEDLRLGVYTESGNTTFENGGSLEAIGLPEKNGVIGFAGDTAYVNAVEVATIPTGVGAFTKGIEIGRSWVEGLGW